MSNSIDPDETLIMSRLIWIYAVCKAYFIAYGSERVKDWLHRYIVSVCYRSFSTDRFPGGFPLQSCLCICGVCFVIIWSSSLHRLMPRERWVSWCWISWVYSLISWSVGLKALVLDNYSIKVLLTGRNWQSLFLNLLMKLNIVRSGFAIVNCEDTFTICLSSLRLHLRGIVL